MAQCEAGQAFPATGQVTCWDSSGTEIPCDDTGHDGDIRAGADLWYTDNGLTITDNNTQLEWMKQDDNNGDCNTYPDNLDKDCTFTWDDAFNFVARLNTEPCFANACDWRVPNVKELQSIVNYENYSPAVSTEFNTGCVENCTVDDPVNACSCTAGPVPSSYWSSTSIAVSRDGAWFVFFVNGNVSNDGKDAVRGVRAVRGGL